MNITWDTFEQLKQIGELQTAIIEGITIVAAFSVVVVLLIIRSKYKKLTKKGFMELLLGFFLFSLHFVFDLLDTLVTKKISGENTQAYLMFDMFDAVLSFAGLFIIGFAFVRIAKYGMELWEGNK